MSLLDGDWLLARMRRLMPNKVKKNRVFKNCEVEKKHLIVQRAATINARETHTSLLILKLACRAAKWRQLAIITSVFKSRQIINYYSYTKAAIQIKYDFINYSKTNICKFHG